MKKMKRRKFMGEIFCWATALAAAGWVSTHPEPSSDPEESEDSGDSENTDDREHWDIPEDSCEPEITVPKEPVDRIPDATIQPCYGVAPIPPRSER